MRHNGAAALQYLHEHPDSTDPDYPAVMLLDINMPGLGGIDVLRAIKSDPQLKAVPVVMLTSSNQDTDLKTCYELGANGYVIKPIDLAEFHDAVKSVGRFWGVVNESPVSDPQKETSDPVEVGA